MKANRYSVGASGRGAALAVMVGLGLTACGGGGVYADQAPDQRAPAGSAGSGSASSHGAVQRSETPVEISRSGDQYVARKRVSLGNDFGGASQAQVTLGTSNGAVTALANQGGGYGIEVQLEARASSESEARRGLDSLSVEHTDTLAAGSLRLTTRVQFGSLDAPGTPLPGGISVGGGGTGSSEIQRSGSIVAGLPPSASYVLTPSSSNGSARASGLSGSAADLSVSNGAVTLNGRWDTATLSSANGLVSVSGDYAQLDAHSGNGLVEAALQVNRSLTADIGSSTGSVDVELRGGNAGYDLTAQTSTGNASIDVAGTAAVGEQSRTSAHRRSGDYGSRSVKAQVDASTSTGNVHIHQ